MGLAMFIGYLAYIIPAWHMAIVSILLVYIAAKERKALYPERQALAILKFLVQHYITKTPINAVQRSKKTEKQRRTKHRGSKLHSGLFVFPKQFLANNSALGTGIMPPSTRRVYAAKLGTPISLEVTLCDAAGKLYPRTRTDVIFDGQHYTVVSDSTGQFEIYPIISEFGRKDLTVKIEDRVILSESFDIQKG